jgi:transporter family-2 protein
MSTRLIGAVVVALATGTAIALQSTLNGRSGAVIGPVPTGFLVNALGGSMALLVILGTLVLVRLGLVRLPAGDSGLASWPRLLTWLAAAGFLGILIIMGISFSVQGVGVTAGLSAVIMAQLVVGLLVDRAGGAGGAEIAVSPARLAGILAMALGVWLLVPRS